MPRSPISEKQLAANRANAVKSHGPRTPEGKARSSQNALKHGLAATSLAAASPEDLEELARLQADAIAFYGPIDSQEYFAVIRIAQSQQMILRASRLETALFNTCSRSSLGEAFHRMAQESNAWALLLRYQAQADRHYRRAIEEFERLKALRTELPNDPILESQPLENEPASAFPAIAAPPPETAVGFAAVASALPLAGKWDRPLPPSSYARPDQRAWRATTQSQEY